MSSRLETLQVARLSPQLLGESTALVETFVRSCLDSGGGFRDRDGHPDLYYTVFGLDCLLALGGALPDAETARYLRGFGAGEALDLVHLSCLAHCWANLEEAVREASVGEEILARVASCRTEDGGFGDHLQGDGPSSSSSSSSSRPAGTIYDAFLAVGIYDNLGKALPDPAGLERFLGGTRRADGAFADGGENGSPVLPVTAAAVTLLRSLGAEIRPATAGWLLSQAHSRGGFLAAPAAPMPDLLSTAVALHALAGLEVDLDALVEPCLDFVDTLWTNRGAFHGSWADDEIDCEYTYYGLLALGHLSVWVR